MQPGTYNFTLSLQSVKEYRKKLRPKKMVLAAVIDNNNKIFIMAKSLVLKQTTLGRVPDGKTFFVSKRTRQGYKMIKKRKGVATYTSNESDRSYDRPTRNKCFVPA